MGRRRVPAPRSHARRASHLASTATTTIMGMGSGPRGAPTITTTPVTTTRTGTARLVSGTSITTRMSGVLPTGTRAYAPFRGYGYGYPTGELRLDVAPRNAEVYVDGYYAGRVDDFDGVFQSLALEEGTYHIEIVEPGFAPLQFDVRIYPGRKITYRGDLGRERR